MHIIFYSRIVDFMPTDKTYEAFLRLIDEKFINFKKSIEALFLALVGNNVDKKNSACAETLVSAQELMRSVASSDVPQWLGTVINALHQHGKNLQVENHCYHLNKVLATQYVLINNHKWSFTDSAEAGFNFDKLFEQFRDESRIPELFDELIAQLSKIVSMPDIDSKQIDNALKKLIETLKLNRKGTYFSTIATWDFVNDLFKNFLWVELCKIPILGGLLEALRKTFEDTDKAIFDLHNDMQVAVKSQIKTEVELLTYNRRGLPDKSSIKHIETKG